MNNKVANKMNLSCYTSPLFKNICIFKFLNVNLKKATTSPINFDIFIRDTAEKLNKYEQPHTW